MNRVYFDQAATSFPKAPGVGDAMKYYLENVGANINRGVYSSALSAEEIVLETREALCRLFNFQKPKNVIFTMNITQSLNMLLKGLLKPNDHCIVSSMEHNAVMRPLLQLGSLGISFTRVKGNSQGFLDPQDLIKALQENTRAVIMTHASNVCGTILPLKEIGKICKNHGLIFIVDSAQTAGSLTIDLQDDNIDALAFTGHKGLLGPQGIGGFLISTQLAQEMDPLFAGGTGSLSDREDIPPFLPDKFEAGTPNIPGIFGLHRALAYLEKEGIENLQSRAMELTGLFLEGVQDLKNIKLIGPPGLKDRTAVVSLDFTGKDNGEIAYILEKDYGIMTRSGLHCAPSAHQTLGTFPQGTVRFSFSHFNTTEEINYALQALSNIAK
ncbi:MAG: aminotransferase class V-fold PLP-dependent enzyme [Peptococcaceae bacterium]|nr:aminotransferase class V-fold PLP-dependent enzyme [Peptococcaceae bacterium]